MEKFRLTLLRCGALLTGVLLLATRPAAAQAPVPNASFETWQNRTVITLTGPRTIQMPQGWNLGLVSSLLTGIAGAPVRFDRSTVAHSGSTSLRFTLGTFSGDTVGSDLRLDAPINGATVGSLTGWMRTSFTPSGGDNIGSSLIYVLRNRPGGGTDTIGYSGGALAPTQANTWEQFTTGIFYMSGTPSPADTISINLGFYTGNPATDQLWIDDLVFNRTTDAPHDLPAPAPLTVAPNPVPGGQTWLTVDEPLPGKAALWLTDATGRAVSHSRVVKLEAGENRLPISTAGLAPGVYTARLVGGTVNQRTARIVVE